MFQFILIGFFAQIVDGALGMAYGVTSASFLLTMGIPPVMVSASVHTAEIFTSGVSGLSHLKFGNVDFKLFKRLALAGVAGGACGAYLLTTISVPWLKAVVAAYLLVMGMEILRKAYISTGKPKTKVKILPLGLAGGFFDAVGGGGWGPIVTSTLVARGNKPRFAVGSVNLAEFFVTLVQVMVFVAAIGFCHWRIVAGLAVGGVIAAPFAAYACKRLPRRFFMVIIGILVIFLSVRTLSQSF